MSCVPLLCIEVHTETEGSLESLSTQAVTQASLSKDSSQVRPSPVTFLAPTHSDLKHLDLSSSVSLFF